MQKGTTVKTLYILCLEKGYACGSEGISYNEMVQYLKDSGVPNTHTVKFHEYFYVWFFDSFFMGANYMDRAVNRAETTPYLFRGYWLTHNDEGSKIENHKYNGQLNIKCPLTFEATEKYITHLSSKAQTLRNKIALGISIAALLVALAPHILKAIRLILPASVCHT